MVPETDLEDGQLRLLDVDNRVVVPVDTHIRFIVTGQDVIHDFAVPSLGLKLDCCPGRLNQTSVLIEREGVFYGQCSEICGVYHGFIPICIEAVSAEKYLSWIDSIATSPFQSNYDNNLFIFTNPLIITNIQKISKRVGIIPTVDTDSIVKARIALSKIYNYLRKEDPVAKYLKSKALHNLKAPEGNTQISYSFFNKQNLLSNVETFTLSKKYIPSQYSQDAGVYYMFNDENDYVGSAINFRTR